MSELGMVIYSALDYGLGEDEERALPADLESLLEVMAEGGVETDDEGIGDDDEDGGGGSGKDLGVRVMEVGRKTLMRAAFCQILLFFFFFKSSCARPSCRSPRASQSPTSGRCAGPW